MKKFLNLNNYCRLFFRSLRGPNSKIDRLIKPVTFKELDTLRGVKFSYFDIKSNEYEKWIEQFFPDWKLQFINIRHKKLMEFYTTYTLLEPGPDDVFMDAAGGVKTYLNKFDCEKKYLQDIKISQTLRSRLGPSIEYIECDAGNIPLPDESISKISCHHAFEHFRKDSDKGFISEIQRLLRIKGKCGIIHLFLADKYVEVTDAFRFKKKYDNRSKLIRDPTAGVPGGTNSGNYARIYDIKAFQERILDNIDRNRFKVSIFELRMDGKSVPDLSMDCHKYVTAVNRPYRSLLIERIE